MQNNTVCFRQEERNVHSYIAHICVYACMRSIVFDTESECVTLKKFIAVSVCVCVCVCTYFR